MEKIGIEYSFCYGPDGLQTDVWPGIFMMEQSVSHLSLWFSMAQTCINFVIVTTWYCGDVFGRKIHKMRHLHVLEYCHHHP
jgi:hypothetical protein